jgi:anaerobic magnesium-protoporphyrin IX monomethyl ester cyclase
MKIALVCVEDGLMSVGFRKMAAWIKQLNAHTSIYYVPFDNYRSLTTVLLGRYGESRGAPEAYLEDIATTLAQADMVGFSSMTGYAALTARIIAELRRVRPETYIVWGGIHPIIVPEDAIQHADAICTGEGEFAFAEFFEKFCSGQDYTGTRNFWFKQGEKIIKNGFLPLMTPAQMDSLPLLHYGRDEHIYEPGNGFVPLTTRHYIDHNGLSYNTVWSIGCPFKCTYCGNTKFIDNDRTYTKIRHPKVQYIIDEIRAALRVHPHLSTVVFHDDSFMALKKDVIQEFCREYDRQVGVPYVVSGVIPNYVREDKLRLMVHSGLNRVRMGIQNGSERILKFYERPTPPPRIHEAARVLSKYQRYMIPPAYDIILDNPVETRQDVLDNLEFLFALARPYTLNIYSLRAIPNTQLEKQMRERNINIDQISANYTHNAPTMANCLVYLLATCRVPRWLFDFMARRAQPLTTPQPLYPRLNLAFRLLYLSRRALNHLRFMDFSVLAGPSGYWLWRTGLLGWWRQRLPHLALDEAEVLSSRPNTLVADRA